jgi:hypothetical protein
MIDDEMKEWARARFSAHASQREAAVSDEERRRCAHASLAVALQLMQAEFGTQAAMPLQDLLAALQSIEQGSRPKLLEPTKQRGRPKREQSDMACDASVAAAVEILYQDGMPLPDAERYVARRVKRKKLTTGQVRTIREKVMGAEHGDGALEFFRAGVDGAAEDRRVNGQPAKRSADAILRNWA